MGKTAQPVTSGSTRSVGLALLLGWLVPGGGHWYIGRARQGMIFLICLMGLFVGGIALGWAGHGWVIDPFNHPVLLIGQAFAGPVSLLGWVASPRVDAGLVVESYPTESHSSSPESVSVVHVEPDSPAHRAGIQAGDRLILAGAGSRTATGWRAPVTHVRPTTPFSFRKVLWLTAPGTALKVIVSSARGEQFVNLLMDNGRLAPRVVDLGVVFTVTVGALNVLLLCDLYSTLRRIERGTSGRKG